MPSVIVGNCDEQMNETASACQGKRRGLNLAILYLKEFDCYFTQISAS